jgi:hypothetical protein
MKVLMAVLVAFLAGCSAVPDCASRIETIPAKDMSDGKPRSVFVGCDDECHAGSRRFRCKCNQHCPCWKNHNWFPLAPGTTEM